METYCDGVRDGLRLAARLIDNTIYNFDCVAVPCDGDACCVIACGTDVVKALKDLRDVVTAERAKALLKGGA